MRSAEVFLLDSVFLFHCSMAFLKLPVFGHEEMAVRWSYGSIYRFLLSLPHCLLEMRPLLNIQRDPFAQLQGFVTRSFDSCVGWYIINSKNRTRTSDYFTKHLLNLYPGSCIVIYPVELRDGHVWRENECGMLETKKRVRKRAHAHTRYSNMRERCHDAPSKRTNGLVLRRFRFLRNCWFLFLGHFGTFWRNDPSPWLG